MSPACRGPNGAIPPFGGALDVGRARPHASNGANPPFGGGEVAVRGGVVLRSQTTSAKTPTMGCRGRGGLRCDHNGAWPRASLARSPHTSAASKAITEPSIDYLARGTPSVRDQLDPFQVNKQISPIATTGQSSNRLTVRHRPRSFKSTGVGIRSLSRTSTSTLNPDQHTVTHTQLRSGKNPNEHHHASQQRPAVVHRCAEDREG